MSNLNYTLKPHSFDDFDSGSLFNQVSDALKADHCELESNKIFLVFTENASDKDLVNKLQLANDFKDLWNKSYASLDEIVSVELVLNDLSLESDDSDEITYQLRITTK